MKALSTARLRLEPVNTRNASVLWRVMQSEDLRRFQDVPRLSREDFARRVASRPRAFDGATAGRFEWLVRLAEGGGPIGWVSLRVGENAPGTAEVGYSLLAEARGRGLATEAVAAVVASAFSTGLDQVDACCVPENLPSRRLLDALGFTYVRTQSNGAIVGGKPVDICMYRLPKAEWLKREGAAAGL
jgi:[ribosomal protein S5]-alanine N-acetyltransferase